MNSEILKERWYNYRRVYCKEGFIDIWQGDSAHNPDQESKPNYQLNNTITMYRLNGERFWYDRNLLKSLFNDLNSDVIDLYTSDEIWENSLVNVVRRMAGTTRVVAKRVIDISNTLLPEEELLEELDKNLKKQPLNKTGGFYE